MKRAAVAIATSSAVAFASLVTPAMADEITPAVLGGDTVTTADPADTGTRAIADETGAVNFANKSGLPQELEGVIVAIAAIMGLVAIAGVATGPIAGFHF